MITNLEQLTVDSFIALLAGDISILDCLESDIVKVVRNIVFEYKEIADSSSVERYLLDIEELLKAKMSITIFTICKNLLLFHEHDRVREVMIEYGINNASTMNNRRVAAEVSSHLERAKNTVAKIEKANQDKNKTEINLRREFDAQTVALMAYFKFQIDTSIMKATVYAHLVARYNREIKLRISSRK